MSDFNFRGISISELVGQPVVAMVKANDMMARQQVKLLMQNCFSGTGNVYEPVMITMLMRRAAIEHSGDDDSAPIRHLETRFQIPLITLLPINSLAIDELEVSFDMDVHTTHEVSEEDDEDLFSDVSSSPTKSYDMAGSIRHVPRDQTDKVGTGGSGSSPISIKISADRLPLPLGVNTILQAYSKSIYPLDDSKEQENEQKND